MLEQEKRSSERAKCDLQFFSFDVRAESSQGTPVLETFCFQTAVGSELAETLVDAPLAPQESLDDLFFERYGVVGRGLITLDPDTVEFVDNTVSRVIAEGMFDFNSPEVQSISIRRGGSGNVSGVLAVRWLSFAEDQTQSYLLPDYNVVQAIATEESQGLLVDVQGVERFTAAEVRVLMIGEGEDIALGVFVPSACRAEAIEHFMRAVAGFREPSFLYSALEQEVRRILDGARDIGSDYYQDSLTWIRANLTWSVECFDSTTSCYATSESLVLELRIADPESEVFIENFGSPFLRCKISFGNPHNALVARPAFHWL